MPASEEKRLPAVNVWKALYDIRPASALDDEIAQRLSPFLDLRVVRKFPQRRPAYVSVPPGLRRSVFRRALSNLPAARIAVYGVIFVVLVFLFKGSGMAIRQVTSRAAEISHVGNSVVRHAESGMAFFEAFNFAAAAGEFRSAAEELDQFEKLMGPALAATSLTARIFPGNDYVKTALMLHDAKTTFSAAARLASRVGELAAAAPQALFRGDPTFMRLLESARVELENISTSLATIESNRNELAVSIAGTWFSKLPEMRLALRDGAVTLDALTTILGAQRPETVLLLFQNPAEIRATGGFVGSYGVMRLSRGKIVEFTVDDIYNPDGQLSEKILPPTPLQRVTPRWGARDANWFFDFPLSAKKTAAFLEQSTGLTFDLVVAVNPRTVAQLLDLVGPVAMPEYGKVITGDNLWEEMQFQTRAGRDRAMGQPKKFLTIFGPRLLEKFADFDASNVPALVDIFRQALAAKDIQVWARDASLQAFLTSRGWDGSVAEVGREEDYLAVVLSNLGGAKADYVTRNAYSLETAIAPSGEITNTLRITRTHEGDRAKYPWWNAENVTYIRVFVPKGSVLLDVTGASPQPPLIPIEDRDTYTFDQDVAMTIGAAVRLDRMRADIFEESGKTVFGMWQRLQPGESRTITLRWKVPFIAGFAPSHYSLLFQAQSGVEGVFQHSIELPPGSKILALEPPSGTAPRMIGSRFSWVGEALAGTIHHSVSFEFK